MFVKSRSRRPPRYPESFGFSIPTGALPTPIGIYACTRLAIAQAVKIAGELYDRNDKQLAEIRKLKLLATKVHEN